MTILYRRGASDFNPRSPRGERQAKFASLPIEIKISIHAPRGGSDQMHLVDAPGYAVISIHAPRGGSDSKDYQKLAENLCRFP